MRSMTRGADEERALLEERYANYLQVGHNAYEFVLEFGVFHQEVTGPRLHTRLITSPAYAKELSRTLDDSLTQYESSYGPISQTGADRPPSGLRPRRTRRRTR